MSGFLTRIFGEIFKIVVRMYFPDLAWLPEQGLPVLRMDG